MAGLPRKTPDMKLTPEEMNWTLDWFYHDYFDSYTGTISDTFNENDDVAAAHRNYRAWWHFLNRYMIR